MGFYDGNGIYRTAGDNYFDSQGIMRGPNDNFFDGMGIIRGPNDNFFDSQGIMRGPNDFFYDSTGTFSGPKNSSTSSSSYYYDSDVGGGAGSGGLLADIASFLLLGGITLAIIAFVCYCIFGMCYFVFGAMTSSGAEGYVNTSIIIISILITTVVIAKHYEEYISSAVIFYIMNSIITYVLINISSIFFGSFGLSSIIGGAFIVLCLSVVPSAVFPGIIAAVIFFSSLFHEKREKKINKALPKELSDRLLHRMYEKDIGFYKAVQVFARSSANKSYSKGRVNLLDAYTNNYKVRLAAYKYLKERNMIHKHKKASSSNNPYNKEIYFSNRTTSSKKNN